jgi:hypothetical protein
MQKISICFILLFLSTKVFSQDTSILNKITECGTTLKGKPYILPLNHKSWAANAVPYCFKVFITIFADDDGTNVAMNQAAIEIRKTILVNAFKPHNICFMFIGSQIVNNTSLNNFNTSNESDLAPYTYSNTLNIFIHKSLTGSNGILNGLNGDAYNIPNTGGYLSYNGTTARMLTLPHEMGHVFGLYHTFEPHPGDPFHGKESVERNSSNSCYDCDVDGDLVCDTPADPDQDGSGYMANNVNASSCIYTGNRRDECNVLYSPATNNIMSYSPDNCRSIFTVGQRNRFLDIIANETNFEPRMTPDVKSIGSPFAIIDNSGNQNYYAKNLINVSGIYVATGSAQVLMYANKTVLNHKTVLSPTTGRIIIRPFTGCN